MTLFERLKQIQDANGLTDRQFALRLGISPANWSLICKAGRGEPDGRDIGLKVLGGILRAYPDLQPYVLEYIQAPKTVELAGSAA